MDYEKKYKDLIEAVKKLQEANPSNEGIQKWVEDNVPQLAKSKDEKIRKYLIILLQHFCKGYRVPGLEFPVSFKDMLSWLEKQGEKKTAWSEEDVKMIEDAIYSINFESVAEGLRCRGIKHSCDMADTLTEKLHNWLKSLKERMT